MIYICFARKRGFSHDDDDDFFFFFFLMMMMIFFFLFFMKPLLWANKTQFPKMKEWNPTQIIV